MPGPPLLSDLQAAPMQGGDLTAVEPPEGKPSPALAAARSRAPGLGKPARAAVRPGRRWPTAPALPFSWQRAGLGQGCQLASATPWTKV